MRLLLVEDSPRLQSSLGIGLRKAGHALDICGNGSEGLWRATTVDYDVVILDVMLPGIDGLTVLKTLRERGLDTHVLLLTAKDAVPDRVAGLRAGADDYLIKPFAFDELLARIEALGRRRHNTKDPVLRIGDVEIDTASRTVRRSGEAIHLLPREYALLHHLAVHAGTVLTRAEIETKLYDDNVEPMSNVVDAAVYALRKKIDVEGEPSLIVTRRRVGYMLQPPSSES